MRGDLDLRRAIEDALAAALGRPVRIGGPPDAPLNGSLNGRLATDAGPFFLKLAAMAQPVAAEAEGLRALAATGCVRVPAPVAHGAAGGRAFIVLEWLDLHDAGNWTAAGRALAALHGCVQPQYGWRADNSIGASPQINTPQANWAGFWRECRLRPQFALARRRGLTALAAREGEACAASDALLAGHQPPAALLHGDLWRGNLAFDAGGAPVLFDPCVYAGDAETDLALTRLFGGFAPAFYRGYAGLRPPLPGADRRAPLYTLYHLLNHANLFGGGYVAQALALIDRLARG